MEKPREFQNLIWTPIFFYRTIGEDIYSERAKNLMSKWLLKVFLIVGFLNFDIYVVGEILFFIRSLRSFETIALAIAVGPCIAFSLVSNVKQIALAQHKKALIGVLDKLEDMFPESIVAQKEVRLEEYERTMRRVINVLTFLCLAYTSTFSFYPSLKAGIQYNFLNMPFQRRFGFLFWFPVDTTSNLVVFWIVSANLAYCAYLAGVAFLCADLLLVVIVTQICMHFNYIATQLKNYECNPKNTAGNIKFLQGIIAYHGECLTLCETVNDIFSTSLLLNFLTASMQICFIAFQVTSSTVEDLLIYGIFFFTSMVQVFVICYYGDKLCEESLRVGDAAYSQDWFRCDQKYKQLLQFVIMRSQKPASIRPPTFPPISFRTYMKVISLSYQFFALLRTTYGGD